MVWERDEAANGGSTGVDIDDPADAVDSGHARLSELGYKQELKRDLSVLSNFAFSFSIISVLTGITTLYNTGLRFGGTVTMTFGWFLAGVFTMFVGLSMAEICSSYPTSGGLYYWSARLSGHDWAPFASWMTGWFNIVGQWAVTTSVDFSLAQLLQVMILLSTGGNNGGGYLPSKYMVIGFHGGILLIHAILNSLPITLLSLFGQIAAAWNILGVFVLMIAIPAVATERASAKFVFTHFNTENTDGIHNKLYIFVLGLLMSQYTLTGYDASAHMTEETKSADKNGPRGIISSIGISIIVGWCYLLGITFAVTNIPNLLSSDNDAGGYAIAEVFYLAFKSRYGSGTGGIICLGIVAVAIFFCGMSSVTSNSRMVYAFSRDGAMPLSTFWHKVNKQEIPINAVWLSTFVSFCMALTYLGSLVAFQAMVSIATIGLYIAYALPIFFRALHCLRVAHLFSGDSGTQVIYSRTLQPWPLWRISRVDRSSLGCNHHCVVLITGGISHYQGYTQLYSGGRWRLAHPDCFVVGIKRQILVQRAGDQHTNLKSNVVFPFARFRFNPFIEVVILFLSLSSWQCLF